MSKTQSLIAFAIIVMAVVLVEMGMVNSYYFRQHPDLLSLAITVDVTILIPLLFYVIAVRKNCFPPTAVIIVLIFCSLLSRHLLPEDNQEYLKYIMMVVPVAELLALLWFLSKIKKVVGVYREERTQEMYPTDAFNKSVEAVLGNQLVSAIVTTELALLYYAFCGWFSRFSLSSEDAQVFSVYKKNGYSTFFGL